MKRWALLILFLPANLLAAWPEIKADRMVEVEAAFVKVYKKPQVGRDGLPIEDNETNSEFFERFISGLVADTTYRAIRLKKSEEGKVAAELEINQKGNPVETKAIAADKVEDVIVP